MKKNLGSKLGNIGIGIIIIVFGILMNFYTEPGYGRAAGVITKLKLTEQSIMYSKYEVYVSFTAQDGKTYENVQLEAYSRDMEEGGELAEEIYAGLFESLRTACMRKCGSLLGSRDYSVKRLREKLCDAGFPAAVIDEAVEKLERAGYLNDIRFAQSYVRSHMRDRSRLRIMRDLAGKGISETVMAPAL